MYPSSHQRPTLLALPQLLIPSAYPNTASNVPVTYTSPSLPPLADEKTYGQLLAEQEDIEAKRQKDRDERERLKRERALEEDRRREVEERRIRDEQEKREAIVKRKADKKREEKEKRRLERQERRERRLQEEKERLKRKHIPRAEKAEPKAEDSKQQPSTDERWTELVRELSGTRQERLEKKRRAEERQVSLWSRKGDEVAGGMVEAVTDSDTDSSNSMTGRPILLHDLASSSSSDALSSRSAAAKRDGREAMWAQSRRDGNRRRRHVPVAAAHASHAAYVNDQPLRHQPYESRSRSAEPTLLWSQPTPPRTPRASSYHQHTSDSLWSTPAPQLQLHSRPRDTYYTPPHHPSIGLYDAPSYARLLELPETLLHPPAAYAVPRPQFVPLRSSGTAVELSSEEDEADEEELDAPATHAAQARPHGKFGKGRQGGVRERWVNLLDEERLAVFSDLNDDHNPPPMIDPLSRQAASHQSHAFTRRVRPAGEPAYSVTALVKEAAVSAEDGELQDDELLQKARELNYHALLLKKKRASHSKAAVFTSTNNTPDSHTRQLAVSPAVEQKVEAEMAKLRQRLNQPTQGTAQPVVTVSQAAQMPPQAPSRPPVANAPAKEARPSQARSMEQQRLFDKLAAIEQKLAETPPLPARRVDNRGREDDERRRRQHIEAMQQHQEAEARDLTHRLHTIMLSPPSAASTPPRTATPPPPNIPLVSVHPSLRPVPLPPQAREKLTLLKGRRPSRGKVGGERAGGGRDGMEEEALYEEAQALIAAFRTEFGGAMKAHTQNL